MPNSVAAIDPGATARRVVPVGTDPGRSPTVRGRCGSPTSTIRRSRASTRRRLRTLGDRGRQPPTGIAASADAIWVATASDDARFLSRIDPGSTPSRAVPIGNASRGPGPSRRTATRSGSRRRGGRLRGLTRAPARSLQRSTRTPARPRSRCRRRCGVGHRQLGRQRHASRPERAADAADRGRERPERDRRRRRRRVGRRLARRRRRADRSGTRAVTTTIPVGKPPGRRRLRRRLGVGRQQRRRDGDPDRPAHRQGDRDDPRRPQPAGAHGRGGRVWVTVTRSRSRRAGAGGGTLRVDSPSASSRMDPALSVGTFPGGQLLYATCAKLLNYPDTPGPAGSQLEAEVASATGGRPTGGRTRSRSGPAFASRRRRTSP